MVTVRLWLLRCVQLEEARDRLEGDKLELAGARHQLEADYKEQLAPLEPSLLASTSVS